MSDLNAREELEAAANWLAHMHEDLSFGLKCAEDGLKLWRYWEKHQDAEKLPEFCDEAESDAEGALIRRHIRRAIGYCPWKRACNLAAEG